MSGGDRPADVLAFEGEWLNRPHDGRYEAAIRERFGVSVTRHLQRVNLLIDTAGANQADPITCRILRERRGGHKKQRNAPRDNAGRSKK